MNLREDSEILKIKTRSGNYFVYLCGIGGPYGQGYYTTPEGKKIDGGERHASSEVNWMEEEWDKEPVIEEAENKIFGHLFTEEEQDPNFTPAQSTPFAGLADLLSKGG